MKFLKVFMLLVTLLFTFETRSEESFLETSIEALQDLLQSNETNSVELVKWYQSRIQKYDQKGPKLNSIQHLNKQALSQAKQLDMERESSGARSLLHGIPILVKDNYETVDAPTTAGSAILEGHWPKTDATQVKRLKQAAAIILAKNHHARICIWLDNPRFSIWSDAQPLQSKASPRWLKWRDRRSRGR